MKEHRPDEENSSELLKKIRRSFLRGLAIVIPAFITIWVIQFLFSFIDGIASPFYRYIGLNIPALGFITAIILIFLVGYFSRNLAVKFTIRIMERVFLNIPLAKSIYAGARELINAFSPENKGRTFKEVCMIEYPRKGVYSIGFVTNEMSFRESESKNRPLTNVYIPLPPNPTTGMLTLVPSEDVIPLNVTVEQGMKLILSAGIVSPEEFAVRDVSSE
ncbi:MAG: DUF502 domain-containing protein [Bacteroidota bacterium]